MPERLWKIKEAAEYLGLNPHTLYKKTALYESSGGAEGIEFERVGSRGKRLPERVVLELRKNPIKEG